MKKWGRSTWNTSITQSSESSCSKRQFFWDVLPRNCSGSKTLELEKPITVILLLNNIIKPSPEKCPATIPLAFKKQEMPSFLIFYLKLNSMEKQDSYLTVHIDEVIFLPGDASIFSIPAQNGCWWLIAVDSFGSYKTTFSSHYSLLNHSAFVQFKECLKDVPVSHGRYTIQPQLIGSSCPSRKAIFSKNPEKHIRHGFLILLVRKHCACNRVGKFPLSYWYDQKLQPFYFWDTSWNSALYWWMQFTDYSCQRLKHNFDQTWSYAKSLSP